MLWSLCMDAYICSCVPPPSRITAEYAASAALRLAAGRDCPRARGYHTPGRPRSAPAAASPKQMEVVLGPVGAFLLRLGAVVLRYRLRLMLGDDRAVAGSRSYCADRTSMRAAESRKTMDDFLRETGPIVVWWAWTRSCARAGWHVKFSFQSTSGGAAKAAWRLCLFFNRSRDATEAGAAAPGEGIGPCGFFRVGGKGGRAGLKPVTLLKSYIIIVRNIGASVEQRWSVGG